LTDPLPSRLIYNIWARMADLFGHRWTSAYGEDPYQDGAGDTWARALAGLTPEEIGAGLRKVSTRCGEWPPTAPEFRGLCEPTAEDLGLPDEEAAFTEAARNANPSVPSEWSHTAILVAARRVGMHRIRHQPYDRVRPAWARVWPQVVSEVREGRLDEKEAALPSPTTTEAPRERARIETVERETDRARALLGGVPRHKEGSGSRSCTEHIGMAGAGGTRQASVG